jgi:prevent-host-death family protein
MTDHARTTEITTTDLRARVAGTINDVSVRGQIVYITSHGRRVAAIVPVPMAEQIENRPV